MEDVSYPRSVKPPGGKGHPELCGLWDGGKPASAACLFARYELEEAGDEDEKHSFGLFLGKARVMPSSKIERNLTLIRSPTAGLRQAEKARLMDEKRLIWRCSVQEVS